MASFSGSGSKTGNVPAVEARRDNPEMRAELKGLAVGTARALGALLLAVDDFPEDALGWGASSPPVSFADSFSEASGSSSADAERPEFWSSLGALGFFFFELLSAEPLAFWSLDFLDFAEGEVLLRATLKSCPCDEKRPWPKSNGRREKLSAPGALNLVMSFGAES
jgi:hypothetical protein